MPSARWSSSGRSTKIRTTSFARGGPTPRGSSAQAGSASEILAAALSDYNLATLVASEASPERVFHAVSEESARVLEVDACFVWRYEGDDTATIVGRFDRHGIVGAHPLVQQVRVLRADS